MWANKGSLRDLEKRSYKSYLARVQTAKRLQRTGNLWNAAQFSLATALVAASILLLVRDASDARPVADSVLASLAVLSLVVSIVVTYVNYPTRAQKTFQNYRELQAFSVEVETIRRSKLPVTSRKLRELQRRYDQLLDSSENHSSLDNRIAEAQGGTQQRPWSMLFQTSAPKLLPATLIALSLFVLVFTASNVLAFI